MHTCLMSHLLVFVLVLVLKELVSVLLQLVLTATLVKCSLDTGELGRSAVDRGHGGATTRRTSPATRPWWWWWWYGNEDSARRRGSLRVWTTCPGAGLLVIRPVCIDIATSNLARGRRRGAAGLLQCHSGSRAARWQDMAPSPPHPVTIPIPTLYPNGSVAEWLACWTQAQKGPGSNRSRDAVW